MPLPRPRLRLSVLQDDVRQVVCLGQTALAYAFSGGNSGRTDRLYISTTPELLSSNSYTLPPSWFPTIASTRLQQQCSLPHSIPKPTIHPDFKEESLALVRQAISLPQRCQLWFPSQPASGGQQHHGNTTLKKDEMHRNPEKTLQTKIQITAHHEDNQPQPSRPTSQKSGV